MKTISWKNLALAAAFAGSLTITSSVLAASQPDAWVTSKVKLSLFTTENVGSTDINVDTMDGRVTLHGTVGSEAEKARAEQVARSIDGVREVRNMLAVVPPAKQDAVAAKDAEIEDRVEQALAADKSLSDSDIDVASVNGGIVVLEGSAATLSDHVRAVETARDVKGVRQVKSEVKSPTS
jgi:osmotically-inducible protein OsmY